MNNDPNVPNDSIQTELQSEVGAHSEHTVAFPRTTMAGMLILAALATFAVTTFVQSDRQTANAALASAPTPTASLQSRSFALGFVEFEDFLSGGVPGLVPPRSR